MNGRNSFAIRGDICWSRDARVLNCMENVYAVCENGVARGVFRELPERYAGLPVEDFNGLLVFPGMVDLHIHAPQFTFRGLGMDLQLLDWLKAYTFPEEARYADPEYADRAYSDFSEKMKKSATTRAVIFATIHTDATVMLMDKLEESGLICYVGKVNMDRDAPDDLREPTPERSAYDTFGWINRVAGRYRNVMPILTPRFLPSCSDALLGELHEVQRTYGLPVQSHLSENPEEVELVRRLFPKAAFYGDGYRKYGLFGGEVKTVMAHCVYSPPEEAELLRDRGVFVAHCPASNMNLASGIAPIRRYLNMGIRVGLGSDVAGGESESVFRAMADCVQVSKIYHRMADPACEPLSFEEAFYLATVGGGAFFGRIGGFEDGYAFDAVVLDDRDMSPVGTLPLRSRAERAVYLEADRTGLRAKYIAGRRIL